jgi:SulP family sulfate permease
VVTAFAIFAGCDCGLTVAIIALPLAMALAIASTPEKGLYTAADFLISALGGSRVQIDGPTVALIRVVFVDPEVRL